MAWKERCRWQERHHPTRHAGILLHLQNQYDQPGWKLKKS